MHVTVCIATCERPEGLARLLESIGSLRRPEDATFDVAVIDNDPRETGRSVCAQARERLDVPIRYEVEPRRGIPSARNAAVACVPEAADFIAFVDDDETVEPDWLAELVAVQASTGADVVTGPAVPRLPPETPEWLAGAFDMLRYETGTDRPFAFTHNVMARREVFRAVQPNFDERLTSCGGSDTHFFQRVGRAGFRIVWADAAVTREWVPPGRISVGWLLRRSLRIGGTDTFIERDLDGRAAVLVRTPPRALRYAMRGLVRLATVPARGRAALLAAGQDWARAAGLLAGLIGYRHGEYRVPS
jgi:glycosyltransferase involved in cell wall biosynthesis